MHVTIVQVPVEACRPRYEVIIRRNLAHGKVATAFRSYGLLTYRTYAPHPFIRNEATAL